MQTNNYRVDNTSLFNSFMTASFPYNSLPIFYENYQPTELQNLKIDKRSNALNMEGKGKWTPSEQRLYIQFLKEHMEDMGNKVARKSNKVFLKMSKLVKTRSADQCRSHHQKILKYHYSLELIIKHYEFDGLSFQLELPEQKKNGVGRRQTQHQEQLSQFVRISQKQTGFRIQINAKMIANY